MENQNIISNDIRIDQYAQMQLNETAKWAKFLAILGFIGSVIIALMALFMMGGMMDNAMEGSMGFAGVGALLGFIYLVAGAIYFFISLFLYRFATGMQRALSSASQDEMNMALKNHKMVYKVVGIITIVYLGLMALIFILGMFGAMMS